ncbi:CDP-Glycerol:Poly(glycerophosphate) glycerophosphotransferase [Pseudomonas delhiensis]|uniref:CDP-Glycerol:Poly(Glycerophosphate) glycerophosphotransferase n=2 Tax=Pseudomonas delhiensis TaxID=366289 RepID=A0ABY1SUN6_9PSED|nr:methyltransferase domain-containing protein [Pseudomonas delhiensis]SNT02960.1 CDP-Glycerol:Poly(glycerophosphate) glycerophosphotransferase [Pseudomonas delhiensis]
MLHKIGVPLASYIYNASLRYLKVHNSYSVKVLPDAACSPVFLLHSGAALNAGGVDHVRPWIPVFKAVGIEFVVVARLMDTYEALLREYPDVPVSLVSTPADVDTLLHAFPSLRGFFYVANTANNNLFLRCSGGHHVFLGHGDSDKSSSMNRAFKSYDEIYVAGQAHIDRFANAEFDTTGLAFRIIGRPDNRHLFAQSEVPADRPERLVYIPTWEGYCGEQDYSSLAIARDLLVCAHRVSGLPVVGKLHPLTGSEKSKYLSVDAELSHNSGLPATALSFVDRRSKLTDLLAPDAIFVCDISAAVSECLALDRPIFVYVPADRDIRVVSGRMGYADYTYTFSNPEEFAAKLQAVLDGNDPLAAARRQALEYFVSPSATRAGAFEKALRELASGDTLHSTDEATHSRFTAAEWPKEGCRTCGSTSLAVRTVTCTVPKMQGATFDFTFCRDCGFVSNSDNLYDYAEEGFVDDNSPEEGTRAGDGVNPRREYRIAEMAADIVGRCFPGRRHDLLVFGAGASRDHQLITAQLPFGRVALADMDNYQNVEDFVPIDSQEQFDVVVASEVIEHFTDLENDFRHLFSKVRQNGLVIAGTNIHNQKLIRGLTYPFSPGHVSYHSGRSLLVVARRFGLKVDFRTPAIALADGGPRKRYVFFYRDPAVGECISQYFADHHLAPSE